MIHYCLKCGRELHDNKYICPDCDSNVYLDSIDDKIINASSGILSAINLETNTQWIKYHCGKNGSTGHGFAAEDYNAFMDKLSGSNVMSSGRDNAKDGADRIVDGQNIQVKYCATPKATVNAAFNDNGSGSYRYLSSDHPQILEVPSDQYEVCVKLMAEKIENGQVEGMSNPNDAYKIVRKGCCTYTQAKNLTKAGTIDSLIFDTKTGAIISLSSFGISFSVKVGMAAMYCRNREDFKLAVQLAFIDGLKNGTISLTSSILTSQILRTGFGRNMVVLAQRMSKGSIDSLYGMAIGKETIHGIASGLWDKALSGAAAKNVVVKLVRVNAITNLAVFMVTSIPDTYSFIVSNTISRPQFIKNLVVNASSISGATVGGIIGLKWGKPGAFVGGFIGGAIGGVLSKTIANKISKDDSVKMQELIKIAILELSNEYMIQSQEELDAIIRNIKLDSAIDTNLLRAMFAAGVEEDDDRIRVNVAKLSLEYQFDVISRQRRTIKLLANHSFIEDSINEIDVCE